MNFVDKQHRLRIGLQLLKDRFEALLEVAPVFGTGEQRPHIQGKHDGLGQYVGHIFLGDPPGKSFSDCGLADTRFAHQQRIVLAPPAQDLNHPLHFSLAADQRVDAPFFRLHIEVGGVLIERTCLLRRLRVGFGFCGLFATC